METTNDYAHDSDFGGSLTRGLAGSTDVLMSASPDNPAHPGSLAAGDADRARWPQLTGLFRIVDQLVFWSDSALTIPGTRFRFGLDPVIGLLFPGGGDAVGGVLSLSVLLLALQNKLPVWVLGRMVLNIAVDTAVGSVPLVGDLFDFGFRANQRNMDLLRHHSARAVPAAMPKSYWFWGTVLVSLALVLAALPIVLSVWLIGWLLAGAH